MGRVTVGVSAGYNVLSNAVFADGARHSFHLAHPDSRSQSVQLNGAVVVQAGSELRFKSMLRYASDTQVARVQVSNNEGQTWQNVFSQAGNFTGGEAVFSAKTVSLSAYAGQRLRFRFFYGWEGDSGYPHTADVAGWFFDRVEVVNGGTVVLFEGAENGLQNVTVQASGGYEVVSSTIFADGAAHSFHFAHPQPVNQWLQVNSTLVPQAESELRFMSMLRYASDTQVAQVQVSGDDGQSWQNVFTQAGTFSAGEQTFRARVVSLASYAGRSIRLRFVYAWEGDTGFPHTADIAGWFVDLITITNVTITGGPDIPPPLPPSVLQQPQSQAAYVGDQVILTVQASGSNPLSFQWRKNGAPIPDATTAQLVIQAVQQSAAGNYTVSVSNSAGSTTSNIATLSVTERVVAPNIIQHPQGHTVAEGTSVTFTVSASGTAPFTYQWRKNGALINGASESMLSLSGVQISAAGNYTATVSNSMGSVTSSAATLTVNAAPVAPTITQQPQSQTVTEGSNVNFTVSASGTAPFTYQWKKDGTAIGGATDATLNLSAIQITAAGNYTATVTNSVGSATSTAAILAVNAAPVLPTITQQPQSQTVTEGANVNLTVSVSGTAPFTYQWKKNGTAIGGATGATLNLSAIQITAAGNYTATVTNSVGSVTSNPATLLVNAAPVLPTITQQPQSQTVTEGANVNFTVSASGTAPFTYQWKKNGTAIGGATGGTLNLSAIQITAAGNYTATVTNSVGSVTSNPATLSVNAAPVLPTITQQPQSQTVTEGANVNLTVSVSGTAPFTYQWKKNGTAIGGATGATLNLSAIQITAAGNYTATVTNSVGSVTSNPATLSVNAAPVMPTITQQPQSQTVTEGANVNLTVSVSGTAPFTYQWKKNGTAIGGATGETLSLQTIQITAAGSYAVTVTNSVGSATSTAAILAVNAAPVLPTITQQPQSQTVTEGANVTFTVSVSGTAPFAYQWKKNGTAIGGATSAALLLSSVSSSAAGSYTATVINSAGSATSNAAALVVNAAPVPPTITQQPQGQTVTQGVNVTFLVAVSGSAPFSYQWYKNETSIGGATSSTLNLSNVTVAAAGAYSVRVTNVAGTASSNAGSLAVNPLVVPPAIVQQPQGQTVVAGATVTLGVTVTGTAPLSFQWRKNGLPLGGETNSTIVLPNVTANAAGSYLVTITNPSGSATSNAAVVAVTPQPVAPTIVQQPQSQTVTEGEAVVFSVTANGTSPFSYQWRKNGVPIVGAMGGTLSLPAALANAGSYTVLVSNTVGSVSSNPAVLTIIPRATPPTITQQPENQMVPEGVAVTFSVLATGTAPFTYQWSKDGAVIVGATGAILTLPGVATNAVGNYSVVVGNSVGSATSRAASLRISNTLTVTLSPPAGGTVTAGFAGTSQRELGTDYTLVATPARGFLFTGWSGEVSGTSTRITFTMTPGLSLQANFVEDPFSSARGNYRGLIQTTPRTYASSGMLNLTVTASGSFSGDIRLAGVRHAVLGRFAWDGSAQFGPSAASNLSIRRPAPLKPLNVRLLLDVSATGSHRVTGTVIDPDRFVAGITADQALFTRANEPVLPRRHVPAELLGAYTFVIPATDAHGEALPFGNGWGRINVGGDGGVRLSGRLADGSAISVATSLAVDGSFALYRPLYVRAGAICGQVSLGTANGRDVRGAVTWFKPTRSAGDSSSQGVTIELDGSHYVGASQTASRRAASAAFLENARTAVVSLSGGDLPEDFTIPVTSAINELRVTPPTRPNGFRLSILSETGVFFGRFLHPVGGKARGFSGVILQQQDRAAGFFLGEGKSGKISISAN